ncbi:monovalent cation/H+ antiporter complex subunit F [Sphingobacterium sp. SYP-B4668]|uniref:monovalent cation/H+ antiporter complex subunit F n=1 Tax=Sphingobacterium sp. SYP-B4668 TaxID=2996035 RepID=UPI00053249AB|nr:monovalent cation/H+ antiporter complex subunit F [Sphingobacterium sp. SYP-B4668]
MTLATYFDYIILPILTISVILTFIRLYKGPNIVDRVIALDLIITIGIGIITVYSIRTGQEVLLDVAIILALIAFLGTVAFAYYIEKKDHHD